ncbi:hypothetical protein ABH853_14345 [Pseudomonas sp. 13.2]|uniref:Phage protein n=1 Tax=Pseudomonas sp. 13.2 TaxID=3144665 RepID=A0AAU7BC99_9PSED
MINKKDYLKQLDLVSYERRAAANSLLKRLGIQVQFKRDNPNRFQCRVLDKSDEAVSDDLQQMLFGILYEDDHATTQPLDPDIYDRQVEQGLITAAVAIREQEQDGIGWQWFGGKLKRS